MRIGLFTGSFDPIHIGHIKVMDYLIENNYLDKIIIMATGNYWNKVPTTDINIRTEMLKKIKRDYLIVDGINNKYQYTYEVMEKLRKEYSKDELYLIISADVMVNFNKWKNVEKVLKNKVIVLNRDNIDISKYVDGFKDKDKFIIVQDFPYIDISSTELRKKINSKYLDKNIYDFIVKNNLYKEE